MVRALLFIFLISTLASCGKMPEINQQYNSSTQNLDDGNGGNGDGGNGDGQQVQGGGALTGVDMNGNTRSCTDQSAVMTCTSIFTQSDAFANTCRNNGDTAVMCACHDWICVQ